jgi:hypothetical protein
MSADYPQVTMSLGSTQPFARLEKALARINHGDSAAVVALEDIGGHFFVIQRRGSDGKYKLYQSWVDYFEPSDWESDMKYDKKDIPHFQYVATPEVANIHLTDLNGGKLEHSSALWFESGPFISDLDALFNFISSSPVRPIPPQHPDYQTHLQKWKAIFGLDISTVAITTKAIEPKAQLTAWTESGCQSNYQNLVAELERRHEGYSGPEAGPDEAPYIPSGGGGGGGGEVRDFSSGDVSPPVSSPRKPRKKKGGRRRSP